MELKNQPINKRVRKTLCINFRACAAFNAATPILTKLNLRFQTLQKALCLSPFTLCSQFL